MICIAPRKTGARGSKKADRAPVPLAGGLGENVYGKVEDPPALGEDARAQMPLISNLSAALIAAALLGAPAARALIVYGTGPTDTNNALNTTAPASGAPWANAVQFGTNNATGVYLGNGYILTANHVGMEGGVVINGVGYVRDTTFTPLQITEDDPATLDFEAVDLKLIKIIGLPPLPVVQNLPLNFSTAADLNLNCTIIGWGVGKGTVITNQGWNWGNDTTRALRWGTGKTLTTAVNATYSGYNYEALETSFRRSLGSTTAEITVGDSGAGLFQQIAGAWKLSGVTTTVLQYQAGAALYDGQAPLPVGDQPDAANFVRLARYAHLLRYENWASLKLGSATAVVTGDTDRDGSSNLLEYAFHTEPGTASVGSLPQLGMQSGYLTLTYTQLMSATDLSYVVEESPTVSPGSWTPATVIEETVSTSGMTRVVKAKVAIGGATAKYLRLSVTKLP